jgi:hypothetical protein
MSRLTLLYIIAIEIGIFLHLFAIELLFVLQPIVVFILIRSSCYFGLIQVESHYVLILVNLALNHDGF